MRSEFTFLAVPRSVGTGFRCRFGDQEKTVYVVTKTTGDAVLELMAMVATDDKAFDEQARLFMSQLRYTPGCK